MSKSTQLLEAAVADVIAQRPAEGERPTARQRAALDRAFASVMKIIEPRMRHFIKRYGLVNHWEDAEQVCAIGVHRAIEAYDPEKAMFTTFVNWQLRGELQGLRFRLMDDQRPSAKKVNATTISLHITERSPEGEELSLEALIEDEGAIDRTEACAANHLAEHTSEALMNEYVRHLRNVGIAELKRKLQSGRPATRKRQGSSGLPKFVQNLNTAIDQEELRKLEERIERDREIVACHLFGHNDGNNSGVEQGLTKERIRQITRRAARVISELATDNPRFVQQDAPEVRNDSGKAEILPRGNYAGAGANGPVIVSSPDPGADFTPDGKAADNHAQIMAVSSLRH